MSYIRAGSNPESLYIFGSASGIEIYVARRGTGLLIPQDIFHSILRRWWAARTGYTDREKVTYQGATLEWDLETKDPEKRFLWKFSYTDWTEEEAFHLHESTLFYLVVNNCERWGWKFPGRKETNEERCQRLGWIDETDSGTD